MVIGSAAAWKGRKAGRSWEMLSMKIIETVHLLIMILARQSRWLYKPGHDIKSLRIQSKRLRNEVSSTERNED